MKLSALFRSIRTRNSPTRVTFRQYVLLMKTYLGPQRFRVACMAILLFASIALQLLGPQIIRIFIDTLQRNGDQQVLTITALFYLGVVLGGQLISALAAYVSEDVGWNATNRLRADLTQHCLNLDRTFHSEHTPGELLERVDGNVNTLANFFSQFVIRIVGNGIFLVGVLVLMARENIWFGVVLSIFMTASMVVFVRAQQVATPFYKRNWQSQAVLTGFWGEVLGGLEDIAASGAAPFIRRRYFCLQRDEQRTHLAGNVLWNALEALGTFIDVLSLVIVLVMSAFFFVNGTMTIATVVLLLAYAAQLLNHTFEITEQFGSLQEATASIERINEISQTTNRVQDGPGVPFPAGALAIACEEVSFHYETSQPVLQALSFQVAPSEVVGLIGRSGSGKTTLTRLLMRFYDPVGGMIRLGEQDLRQARLDDLRGRVGLVTQEVQLFQATLRDNVTFFDERIDDQRILKAIEQLGIADWYARLPAGLDTELTGNGGLSAGEAQLLACIRVFLKDPQLILLDEATSRLDPATEKLMMRATEQLLAGRTAIIIAHRLSTVEHVDRILVLEAGRLVEYGLRTELAHDPTSRYARLLQMTHPEELLA